MESARPGQRCEGLADSTTSSPREPMTVLRELWDGERERERERERDREGEIQRKTE